MKRFLMSLLFVAAVCTIGCKSKSAAVAKKAEPETQKRIALEAADPVQKKKAYDFGRRVLTACNTSRFRAFTTAEASPSVIANMSESKLTTTCHKFRLKYGEFKELHLQEIIPNDKAETVVYRYKAEYSKKIANKELRVVLDKDNKLVAIKSTDWKDKYVPMN